MDEEELLLQTRNFLQSEYGQYIMTTLTEMHSGKLANAQSVATINPIRELDRAVGIKEVIEMLHSPME
jgi:hypothetical protein